MAIVIRGAAAEVRHGYHRAATLGAWTATSDGGQASVTATIISQDAWWLSQQPLVFRAPHARGVWQWAILDVLPMAGAVFTARLGPVERP